MTSNNPQTGLHVGLIKGAEFFVSKMEQKIDSEGLPDKIKKATSISSPVVKNEGGYIDIVIDLKTAPMAAAFEYGSGIHGEEGKKYKIPEDADYVAFPRERWAKYKPPPERSSFVFTYVMHPGVKEIPYIRPTISDYRKEISKIIGKEFIESITVRGRTVIE